MLLAFIVSVSCNRNITVNLLVSCVDLSRAAPDLRLRAIQAWRFGVLEIKGTRRGRGRMLPYGTSGLTIIGMMCANLQGNAQERIRIRGRINTDKGR